MLLSAAQFIALFTTSNLLLFPASNLLHFCYHLATHSFSSKSFANPSSNFYCIHLHIIKYLFYRYFCIFCNIPFDYLFYRSYHAIFAYLVSYTFNKILLLILSNLLHKLKLIAFSHSRGNLMPLFFSCFCIENRLLFLILPVALSAAYSWNIISANPCSPYYPHSLFLFITHLGATIRIASSFAAIWFRHLSLGINLLRLLLHSLLQNIFSLLATYFCLICSYRYCLCFICLFQPILPISALCFT